MNPLPTLPRSLAMGEIHFQNPMLPCEANGGGKKRVMETKPCPILK